MRLALCSTLLALILVPTFGCSASIATIPDDLIRDQVRTCLNSKPSPGGGTGYSFAEVFEIVDVSVRDRMVKDKEAKALVSLKVRTRKDYYGIWSEIVGVSNGTTGQVITHDVKADFEKFDKGWRIVCGQ
jgi:hypothetical protein